MGKEVVELKSEVIRDCVNVGSFSEMPMVKLSRRKTCSIEG